MSVTHKEISGVGVSGNGGGGFVGDEGDEDEDEEGGGGGVCGVHANEDRRRKQRGYGCGGFRRNLGKAKQVVLIPFTKAKMHIPFRKQTKAFLPPPPSDSFSSSAAPNVVFASSSSSGKERIGDGGSVGGKGCYFCFTRPLTLESPTGSRISDPNDPNFTYDMLKDLIEQSDFYSPECNPHLDIFSD